MTKDIDGEGKLRPVVDGPLPLAVRPASGEEFGRISEARFRSLSTWEVFQLVAVDGTIVFESPTVTEVLGYEPHEMVGRNAMEFVHPEDLERVQMGAEELAEAGSHRCITLRVRHKDGSWRWLESYEVNLLDDPCVGAVAVNYREVTERMEAELALIESHRSLQMVSRCNAALLHSESESELLATICTIAVETGDFSMAWVGYAENDDAKSVSLHAHAGEAEEYLSQISVSWSENEPAGRGPVGRAIRTGQPVVISDITREDSFRPWVATATSFGVRGLVSLPLRKGLDALGVLVLYTPIVRVLSPQELGLLHDMAANLAHGIVTLRSHAENRVAQHKLAQQAALLDKATDAIFVRDLDHRITYWNKSAERLYGWTAEEALGRSSLELLHQASGASDFGRASDQMLATREWAGEFLKLTKAGRELMIEARWTLVLDGAGRPESILAINTDVTARKKLEAQFLRAQRMESIGTLAGGIAHDLNNVLAPILLSLELLKSDLTSPDSLELVSVLESSANHGASMVGQLLSFSRGMEGLRVEVQVRHLVADIEKIANETFFKHVKVRTSIAQDLWSVVGDPTQLHQVLLNLSVNGRDAMPNGGLLKISAENRLLDEHYAALNIEAKPGPYVVLSVEDNGSGMPPAVAEQIFDPFYTTKETGKGTGLGLSTVLGIVKSHGGFLRVYTEPGRGTEFRVYLPANTDPSTEILAAAAAEMPRGSGQLILVVDDEISVRHVTKQTLEAYGYEVVLAADGAEAVAIYARRTEEIAAVLTDMMMPVMDGLATIRVLQKLKPEVAIIAASGLDANESLAQATTLGVKSFLNKPYTADKLLTTLRDALAP